MLVVCAGLVAFPWSGLAAAQGAEPPGAGQTTDEPPVLITADEMDYDRELGTATARGHVEVTYQDRVLLADTVSYNSRQDVVTASGNVSLVNPDGSVMFAEYTELTGDLKKGIAKNIRLLMADRSRVAALEARRDGSGRNEMTRAVYSPCQPCRDDPERPPVWQIKAETVTQDETAHQVEYHDAWIEMFGQPVAYTPYLSHPDPSVKRRSGFLPPTWGGTKNLGATLRLPYFWELGPSSDFTFTPVLTASEGPVLSGEYRQRFDKGETKTGASITRDSRREVRGHIQSRNKYEFNDVWRSDVQIDRTTDDTYMRRYGFGNKPWLTTRGTMEGFFGRRSYFGTSAYTFQGLRRGANSSLTPIVMPVMDYNYMGDPGRHGGYWTLDANALVLEHERAADSRRVSVIGGWSLPYTAPAGDIYKLSATLRGDAYHIGDLYLNNRPKFTGMTGRVNPEVALDWRYPFARDVGESHQVLEPIVTAAASPPGGNTYKIPNSDSRDFEFDDTNLFSRNRFTGLDRIETGPRINYGVHFSDYSPHNGHTSVLVGQTIRSHVDHKAFGGETGLENKLSDYVGRVDIAPYGNLNLLYRFRLAREDLSPQRNEITLGAGPKPLRVSANYVQVRKPKTEGAEFGDREELALQVSSHLTQYWRLGVGYRYNLASNGGPVNTNVGLTYEDECFLFLSDVGHDFTADRDIHGGTTFMFRVIFKSLGQVQTGL
ncbi:MAG: LPS assembly protein LptD [Alphaproteobacteria bacterium]